MTYCKSCTGWTGGSVVCGGARDAGRPHNPQCLNTGPSACQGRGYALRQAQGLRLGDLGQELQRVKHLNVARHTTQQLPVAKYGKRGWHSTFSARYTTFPSSETETIRLRLNGRRTMYAATHSSPAVSPASSATLLSTLNPECCHERICSTTSRVMRPSSSSRRNIFASHSSRKGVRDRSSGNGMKVPSGVKAPYVVRPCP